ncbi:FeoB-associated Cys-rich membrane protein [Cyclobacterium xiamenense]
MWQELIVGILFVGVLGYWAYKLFSKKTNKNKNSCGCENCH